MEMLSEVYAAHGRDARKLVRPHTVLCQWKASVERALNNRDEELVEHCQELGILHEAVERDSGSSDGCSG